ncbi:MAG: FecR domain-containing protein [Myxococcales bacterium]
MKTTRALVLAALLAPAASQAQNDPCGGIRFEKGRVSTGRALAVDAPASEEGAACVRAIGKALAARPYIRGVTVAAQVPDAERFEKKPLASAQRAVDLLVEQGLPRQRLSAVAPRTEAGEPAGLVVRYVEAPAEEQVAVLEHVAGQVQAGRDLDALRTVNEGAKLPLFGAVRTGESGHATVVLADGSRVQLGPSSTLRLNALMLNTALKPQVQLELLDGEAEITAASGGEGALFEVTTRTASVQAGGARFRVASDAKTTRLETLAGDVRFSGQVQQPKANQALGIAADGRVVDLRAQLTPPSIVAPVFGTFRNPPTLSWTGVEGAARYRVELAADAGFRRSARWVTTEALQTALADLEPGKWFWRVRALDADGFGGLSSKIYAFTVDPDAPEQTPPAPRTPAVPALPRS